MLVLNGRKNIHAFINQTIRKMANNPVWIAAQEQFSIAEYRVTAFKKFGDDQKLYDKGLADRQDKQ